MGLLNESLSRVSTGASQEEHHRSVEKNPQRVLPKGADLSHLNICFVVGTLGQGGAERQLFYMLRALRQSGASARVLSLDRGGFWERPIRELGVPVSWIGQSKTKICRLLRIIGELRHHPPQVIQSQHFYTNSYAAVSACFLRAKSVGALRSNGVMDVQDCGMVGGWLNLNTPGVLAANSGAALRYAIEKGMLSKRVFLLPSVVPTAEIKPAHSQFSGPIRLLAVGRLVRAKRFDRFLEVLARLRSHLGEEVSGILVGAGPLETELKAQAAALGLDPAAIDFRGSLADIAPVYGEADVFVLTSDYEGTPNVVLEAMSAGLPVVATRVGGVQEVLHFGENGISVDPEDLDELQSALTRLIQDRALRTSLGRRARAFVEAHHAPQQLPQRLSQLYRLALSTKKESLGPEPVANRQDDTAVFLREDTASKS